jgi:hypothetical protein
MYQIHRVAYFEHCHFQYFVENLDLGMGKGTGNNDHNKEEAKKEKKKIKAKNPEIGPE